MRKFHVNNASLFLCLALLFLNSCTAEFVPDPLDPRLPKYTDNGNNVAGAYIDDEIWKSEVYIGFPSYSSGDKPYVKTWIEQDSLKLVFTGSTQEEYASIEFHLTGFKITQFEDLIELNEQKISLDGPQNTGYYIENYTPSSYSNKGIGQIYFKNVRYTNDKSAIIISGTFGFTMSGYYEFPLKVRSGRFDYRIYETYFNQIEQ